MGISWGPTLGHKRSLFALLLVITIIVVTFINRQLLMSGGLRGGHFPPATRRYSQNVREKKRESLPPLIYRGEREKQRHVFRQPSDRIETSDPFWQSVDDDMDLLTYSAHYDDVEQPPLIRVVGAARHPLRYHAVTCMFHGCHQCPVIHRVSGTVAHFRPPNGRKRIGAFVQCPLPSDRSGDFLPFELSLQKKVYSSNSSSPSSNSSSPSSIPSSHSSNSSSIPAPTYPFTIHYSNATMSWYSSRVQDLLKKYSIVPEEGDLNAFTSLGGLVRHGSDGIPLEKLVLGLLFSSNGGQATMVGGETDQKPEAINKEKEKDQAGKPEGGYRWNVTRCFPALFRRFDNHVLLAEMTSASRAMGVEHFLFYNEGVGHKVKATLQVLQSRGWAEVHPWNLHIADNELFYNGQFSAIQDCLYRLQRSSRYVLTGDVDELFVPLLGNHSLVTLLDAWFAKNPNCGSFLFRNTFINMSYASPPSNDSTGTTSTNISSSSNNSRSSSNSSSSSSNNSNSSGSKPTATLYSLALKYHLPIFLHTFREANIWPAGSRSKVALDPRRVRVGSVHVVEKLLKGFQSCVMDQREGLLFHFRSAIVRKIWPYVNDAGLIRRRFGSTYVKEVVNLLEEVERQLKPTKGKK